MLKTYGIAYVESPEEARVLCDHATVITKYSEDWNDDAFLLEDDGEGPLVFDRLDEDYGAVLDLAIEYNRPVIMVGIIVVPHRLPSELLKFIEKKCGTRCCRLYVPLDEDPALVAVTYYRLWVQGKIGSMMQLSQALERQKVLLQ